MVEILKFIIKIIFLLFVGINGGDLGDKIFEDRKIYKASYYHNMFEGRKTSMGYTYKQSGLTCATSHPEEFLGKTITFRAVDTTSKPFRQIGEEVTLFCNDKMAKRMRNRVHFDLTKKAMKILSGKSKGYPGHIQLEIVKVENENV